MSNHIQEKFAKITSLYKQEVALQKVARNLDDIPIRYELLTPEWLTKVICAKVPGAEVVSYTLDNPDEGVTNRRRIFVEYNQKGVDAGFPGSIFCKATQSVESRFMLGLNGGIEGEVKFFNDIRSQLDIEAPRAIFANYDPESLNSIVLMPDMSGEVSFCGHSTPISFNQASNQVTLLAKLHGSFYQDAKQDSLLASYQTMEDFFNTTSGAFDFVGASRRGVDFAKEVIPPRLLGRAEEVGDVTAKSYLIHGHLPRTFIHNDTHLKNWYIRAGEIMGLTDWQTACKGHWSRDLAYTLGTSLAIENRRAWEDRLLDTYLKMFETVSGVSIRADEAKLRYRQQMVSALSMWTVTIAPKENSPDMQPQDSCLEFINRLSTAVDDLESVDALQQETLL